MPTAPFQALLTSPQPVGTLDANGKPTLLGDRPLWMEVSKYFEPSIYFATLAHMRGTSRNLRQAVDDQAAVIRALSEAFDVCAAAARESSLGGSEPTLDDDEDDEDDSDDSGDEDPEQRRAWQRRVAQRERRRLAAFEKVGELEKAAQLRIDELRRLGETNSTLTESLHATQFDLKQAERRAGPAAGPGEEWSFV